jgi:hypothetical protein
MSLDDPLNKRVRFSPTSKTRAKKIRQSNRINTNFEQILLRIIFCFEKAKHWEDLLPTEKIMLELRWTDSMNALLTVGNYSVMQPSLSAREQTSEEDEQENAG